MMFQLKNYKLISCFNRNINEHGGSLIFLKENCKCKERKDIVALSVKHHIEISCAELNKYIIVCTYRPPTGDFITFETVMEDVLRLASNSKKEVIVCGDFNVDLLGDSPNRSKLLLLFKSFNLFNVFLEPTRITPTSATCLDNIFCNCEFKDSSVINCLRSDHSGQTITLVNTDKTNKTKVRCRPITTKKIDNYLKKLDEKLPNVKLDCNSNEMYSNLFKIIADEFESNFETKEVLIDNKIKFCDWATEGIRKSRATLYDLYEMKTFILRPDFQSYVKKYSKMYKCVCHCAKTIFINNKIKDSANKSKAVWTIINNETGKNRTRETNLSLKVGNDIITSNDAVARVFEEFFTNIPLETTCNLDSSAAAAETLTKENAPSTDKEFKFRYINTLTIIKTFKSLNMKKTEDLWGMSVKFVLSIINKIAPILANIFNKCIAEGVFPDLMKFSKIIPLFKSGDMEDPANFRPVSVLPVLSKIFERVILSQMLLHFNDARLFHSQQYGFTKGKSTADAGTALIKHIFDAWEDHHDAIGVFCDLSKAFDCVDHQTLISKLRYYGIGGKALDLISSYLDKRQQRVDINNTKSQGAHVKIGVPQGSILGPFLFLIYINDLPFMVEKLTNIVLFADDTSLLFKVKRRENNFNEINSILSDIHDWFTVNNLLLNSKKTKCIKFTLPNVRQCDTNIILDGNKLDLVNDTVFLGMTIDSKLQWGPHIEKLSGRLSSAAFAVRKIRQLTDVETARLVYFSYFHSLLSYGILLWGRAADIETIFVLQKRAIRSIYKLGSRDSLRELFKEINILTVPCQFIFSNLMYVRKNISTFDTIGSNHDINTRNKHKLAFPAMRLAKVNKSFLGYCIRFYNKLPAEVAQMPENKFKCYIKEKLSKKAYYKIDDYLEDVNAWL
ncbi:hypothetical protein JYU34_000923 [Plutella xylostella]|uniref:Reverse transcriptase domain-containing protein n=3 Tax=Plutella xylostella TaxID=51655 RepID=A0ABQ7Q0L2_PLUXY|nr:hypothetical protein JYU34_020480 [Plutella xylostella]KAG7297200.1 hypothetical protein JYU34_019116 [Plutella xylostella]KAG7297317.1 hypothetical protein JYU34_019282 [Plutella xylostella]KAG7297318.1 hypothetical protein JYU34_019283 [Plutella xylostella]KAG7298747.1 hypothetical protein JYU34_017163 [Plutella xylostella]